MHLGGAEGLAWDEYRARYSAFNPLASSDRPFAPGSESWAAFVNRVRLTHRRLAARFACQTIVAVSHAGFVVASVLVACDIPAWARASHWRLPTPR